MQLMFGKGIRRGVTQAVKRYAKANNRCMEEQYNLDDTSKYLYGQIMIQKLPAHGFACENLDNFTYEKTDQLVKNTRKVEKGEKLVPSLKDKNA